MENQNNEQPKLVKPIVLSATPTADESKRINVLAQQKLLEAMSQGISDPKELAKIIGVRTAADVVLTLDKLSLRKEWHGALAGAGINLDVIAKKVKKLLDSDSEKSVATGVKIALESMGLNSYKDVAQESKNWEEALIEASQKTPVKMEETTPGRYEVAEPEIPDSIKDKHAREEQDAKDLYGRN